MSIHLYTTGVQYVRGRYLALKLHGSLLFAGRHDLKAMPTANEIEYYPEVGMRQVCHMGATQRSLSPSEVRLLDNLLRRIAGFPRLLEASRQWLLR